jgi:hypothetical protein
MIIDVTFLGYGAGLVMLGWFCGMIVNTLFSSLGRVR